MKYDTIDWSVEESLGEDVKLRVDVVVSTREATVEFVVSTSEAYCGCCSIYS